MQNKKEKEMLALKIAGKLARCCECKKWCDKDKMEIIPINFPMDSEEEYIRLCKECGGDFVY